MYTSTFHDVLHRNGRYVKRSLFVNIFLIIFLRTVLLHTEHTWEARPIHWSGGPHAAPGGIDPRRHSESKISDTQLTSQTCIF